MIGQAIASMGAWSWIALACVLLAAEVIVPGTFLLWLGGAAAITGVLFLVLPAPWQAQVAVWVVLSALSIVAWFRYARTHNDTPSEQPDLNRRIETMIGRELTLIEPIADGRGRVRFADTVWAVTGPDLPIGAKVKVRAIDGTVLVVEPSAVINPA